MSEGHTHNYILLVEDSPMDASLFLNVSRDKGYTGEVIIMKYGNAAFQFLAGSNDSLPKAIVIDVSLPDISGLDLLRLIKAHAQFHQIPILVWTGAVSDQDREICKQIGGTRYMSKPFELNEWEREIEKMLVQWRIA